MDGGPAPGRRSSLGAWTQRWSVRVRGGVVGWWTPLADRRRGLRLLGGLVVLLAAVGVWVWLIRSWLDMSGVGRMSFLSLMTGILVLGGLAARYPRLDAAVKTAFGEYFRASFALMAVLLLLWAALLSTEAIVARAGPTLQVGAMTAWGVVLTVAILAVASPARRRRVFARLRGFGLLAPWLYSVGVLALAVIFFATTTFLIWEGGGLTILPAGGTEVSPDVLLAFYLWHFLDAVPLLDVNATLQWSAPATYDGAAVGWLLLGFKVLVIVPVIAAFRGYWTLRRDLPSARKAALDPADGPD